MISQQIEVCVCVCVCVCVAVANVLLTNTTLQVLELQRHERLSASCVQTLDNQIQRSAARGRPHKVQCKWRTELGQPSELQWWRDKGQRSVVSASCKTACSAPLPGLMTRQQHFRNDPSLYMPVVPTGFTNLCE